MHNKKLKPRNSTSDKSRAVIYAEDGTALGSNWMDSLKSTFASLGGMNNPTNALNIEGSDKARSLNNALDSNLSQTFSDNNRQEPIDTGNYAGVLSSSLTSFSAPSITTSDPMINQLQRESQDASITNLKSKDSGNSVFNDRNINNALGGVVGSVTNLFGIQGNKNLNVDQKQMQTADGAVNAISNVASAFGPWGTAIGTGLKLINSIGGSLMGTPKELKDYKTNEQIAKSSGYTGVAASGADIAKSDSTYASSGLAGKLFGHKGNLIDKTNAANNTQRFTSDILKSNKLAMNSSYASSDMFATKNKMQQENGDMWNNGSVVSGKEGTKAPDIHIKKSHEGKFNVVNPITHALITKFLDDRAPWTKKHENGGDLSISGSSDTKTAAKFNYADGGEIQDDKFNKLKFASLKIPVKEIVSRMAPFPLEVPISPVNSQPITSFKEGGSVNVIVDGALHAHKHELKDHPDFEGAAITHKGIPVVTKSEEGDVEQHAEVERDELILHLDVSKRLEELMKEGTDEAAIEAGKLLAEEIVNNTKDSKSKIIKNA